MVPRRHSIAAADLVGTWLLRRWITLVDDGQEEEPFGPEALGMVTYTAAGRMLTTISAGGREAGEADLVSGTDAARKAAVATFVAYAGRYRVEGQDVVHAVEMSLEPRWVGTTQRRHVRLSGDGLEMTLSTDRQLVAGRLGRHRLTWVRETGS